MFGIKKTLVHVEISAAAWDEIAREFEASGMEKRCEGGVIDMRSVGLVRGDDPAPLPKHRPISKNTAPGAI